MPKIRCLSANEESMDNEYQERSGVMFKDFMKKYIGDVTMKGKPAEDIRRDSLFPKNDTSISEIWHKVIKDYLIYDNEAAEDFVEAFEECWEEYAGV